MGGGVEDNNSGRNHSNDVNHLGNAHHDYRGRSAEICIGVEIYDVYVWDRSHFTFEYFTIHSHIIRFIITWNYLELLGKKVKKGRGIYLGRGSR